MAINKSKDILYSNFREVDFINDAYFQDWVVYRRDKDERFWKEFLEIHPQKTAAVDGAKRFLESIEFPDDLPGEEYVQECFDKHRQALKDKSPTKVVRMNRRQILRILVAAVATTILAVGVIDFFFSKSPGNEEVSIRAGYGEMKNVLLPDGSRIILNANSSIQYNKYWSKKKPREVTLNGEAFFDIRHLDPGGYENPEHSKFRVYGKGFTVEVLGTLFDVRQRRSKTDFVLEKGKIRLVFTDPGLKPILMVPGEMVSYDSMQRQVLKEPIAAADFSRWKEKKLILRNPTLKDIIQYLEDTYGRKIVLENESLGSKKIEGPIELNDLDDALFIISTVLNTRVEKTDSSIILHSK